MQSITAYNNNITFEDVWNYRPDDPATYTAVPIVNAVTTVLLQTTANTVKDIADILEVNHLLLSSTIKFELGCTLIDLIHMYRYRQVSEYIAANPEESKNTVAHRFGYSSYGSLWRFTQRIAGMTPSGVPSEAGEELWLVWRKKLKRGESIVRK